MRAHFLFSENWLFVRDPRSLVLLVYSIYHSSSTQSYWDTHLDTIAEGVCQSGRLGRGFRMYSHLLGEQIDSSLLDKFFTVNTIEEQQVLFDSFPEEPFQDCLRYQVI